MAPRKTSKPLPEVLTEPVEAPAPKVPKAPKAAKPAARAKAVKALPEPVAAAPEPVAGPEPVAAPEPAPAAKAGRKPRAAAVKAAPVAEAPEAVAAPEAPQPSRPASGEIGALLTDQARAVLAAINDGRAVELIFADADSNPPRTFEPRQLIFDTFAKGWYVWGWDRRYNAERHHRLELIAQVNHVEGMGRAAQGPYKDGTPANSIGGWLGGEAIQVKAVLLKQWIFAVKQAPAPFPEFKLVDMEEGKAQVSFTGTDLRAIARWVMQFGDGIQILEPQRLADRVKQVGVTWAGKPAAAASAPPAPKAAPAREHRERPERPERPERGEHRSEHREHRAERSEHRPERSEPRQDQDRKKPEPPRHVRESRENQETAKPRPGKIEIRIDRL